MKLNQAIERIQFCYPQIYYACHTRHERKRSSTSNLSVRDSEILVHLDRMTPMTLSELASHMDLARSTLSEAVTKLENFGYIVKARREGLDNRYIGLVLTGKGAAAVRASSVLEASRLRTVLAGLPKNELASIIGGLEALARACRQGGLKKRDERMRMQAR